jgi:pimeloyl-ACP methyl ester carboxylesterase
MPLPGRPFRLYNTGMRAGALRRTLLRSLPAIAAWLLLAGCATVTTVSEADLAPEPAGEAARLAEPGPIGCAVAAGRIEGEHGCALDYETYRPAEPRTAVMVLLAHGFLRNLAVMRGWAAHWASHGVPVTVMSLRHSSLADGRHDHNAADLRRLARALHGGPVLYAGHSAGGLASFLAAAGDGRAVGLLGLDAADSGGLALGRRESLSVPSLFLLGEPSSCNRRDNILRAVPDRPEVTVLRVRGATHCHFENPTDSCCAALCGAVRPPEASARIARTVRVLATAWVLARTGVQPQAAGWVGAGPGVQVVEVGQ